MTWTRTPKGAVPVWSALRYDNGRAPYLVLGLLVGLFAVTYVWLGLARHSAFQTHAFDLGNMDQALWNTIHGSPLRFTDMDVGGRVLTTRLAIHVEPFLFLLAPLYLLHPGPQTLLVVQPAVVATGAVPLYLMARRALAHAWLGLVFPVAYLLHPSLQNALLDDFHAVTLSAAFLAWALYFAWRAQVLPFAVFGVLAASTKEEVGLVIACLGILLAVRDKRAAGVATLAGGLGWFLLCMLVIIPTNSPSGHSPYLARYQYLGHGFGQVALSPLRHPLLVLQTLSGPARLSYLSDLLHPLGYASLLATPVLLLAVPVLLINMLSADPTMYSGFYQYSAEIVPIVVGAAVLGVAATNRATALWSRPHPAIPPLLCLLVLVASLVDTWRWGFSPLARGYAVPTAGKHQAVENSLLRLVPDGASVAASDEIEPHLSGRRWIYLLPTTRPRNGPPAQYIVLDASIPGRPVGPRVLHEVVIRALAGPYGVMGGNDGVLLLRRGAHSKTFPRTFYTFTRAIDSQSSPIGISWGMLRLSAVTVHPRDGILNRSRPAIGVESAWRLSSAVAQPVHIRFYLSPVYSGPAPPFSKAWAVDGDTPTLNWLPVSRWPRGVEMAVASRPLIPDVTNPGSVDVAIGVSGLPVPRDIPLDRRVPGRKDLVKVGTVSVNP